MIRGFSLGDRCTSEFVVEARGKGDDYGSHTSVIVAGRTGVNAGTGVYMPDAYRWERGERLTRGDPIVGVERCCKEVGWRGLHRG